MKSMRVLVGTLALLLILTWSGPASGQSRRPVVFSTQPQRVELNLRYPDSPSKVQARVTYTITSANPDDTLTGALVISFPGNPTKRREPPGKLDAELPHSVSETGVVASFHKQTSCPRLRIEVGPMELTIHGKKVPVERFELAINETKDEMPQLLCFWTKQINANGLRRGIVARINRLIAGDDAGE